MYRTVLLAYDGSKEGRLALREGTRLAQICGAQVVLLAVVDATAAMTMGDVAAAGAVVRQTEDYQAILDEGAQRLIGFGLTPVSRLETGDPVERIAAVAEEVGADLVVVGHHRQGLLSRWLRGSVTAALNDRLSCSLLAARQEVSDAELQRGAPA